VNVLVAWTLKAKAKQWREKKMVIEGYKMHIIFDLNIFLILTKL